MWRTRGLSHPASSGFIEPCLATPALSVPGGDGWVHEIKHDGCRMILRRDGDRVRAFTRRGNDWTDRVPSIVAAVKALEVASVTLDGECVMCREDGVTDFDLLRVALARRSAPAAFLYAFDVIELNGQDLRRQPWEDRRGDVTRVLRKSAPDLRLSEHLEGDGDVIFRHACKLGLEGIVSKRRDAGYRSGRSRDWIKIKNPGAPAMTRNLENCG
jgi:bifunctional non-homologous end joining protein LigD